MRFPRPLQGVRGPRQNSGSIGQRWKRREALASRLVLMGRHHTNPPKPPNRGDNDTTTTPGHKPTTGPPDQPGGGAATTIRTTTNPPPTQPTTQQRRRPAGGPATQRANKRGGRTTQSCGGHSTGETPSNIPNLEAKPGRANGTAPQGVWESRKPPQHTRGGGAPTRAAPPHTPTPTRTTKPAHTRGHGTTRARHQRGPNTDHANTRAPPAHTSPTHAQRRAPGRPIAPALLPT